MSRYSKWGSPIFPRALLRFNVMNIISLSFRGTFGVVKRVVHRRTGEVFAAKFLPLRSSTRTRSFQERDLLSRLAHPRVACLLDFFCTRRTLVLITEMYPFWSILPYDDQVLFVINYEFFNALSRCCSHGLLDHLLLKGSVPEREVNLTDKMFFISQIL